MSQGKLRTIDITYLLLQESITLTLPSYCKLADLKWLSVWCRKYEVNFADVIADFNLAGDAEDTDIPRRFRRVNN